MGIHDSSANTQIDIDEAHVLLADGLAQIGATLEPLLEAVEGYRVARESEGYSPNLARQMAADYHGALLRTIF